MSGTKATPLTGAVCSEKVTTQKPDEGLHSFTLPSPPPVAFYGASCEATVSYPQEPWIDADGPVYRMDVVIPDWITTDQTNRLQRDAVTLDSLTGWDCHIGSNANIQLDTSYLRSRQCNIYPPPSNAAGSESTRASIIAEVNALRSQLQQADLGLPHLAPFETELNYLCYPSGGHYRRHLDQPYTNAGWVRCGRAASDGGSFGGQHTRRVISFIL